MTRMEHEMEKERAAALEAETIRYVSELEEFDLSLADLVENSPEDWRHREQAKEIAVRLASDSQLAHQFLERRGLPVDDMRKKMNVDVALVMKYEACITAMALIHTGQYELLKEYGLPWGWRITNG